MQKTSTSKASQISSPKVAISFRPHNHRETFKKRYNEMAAEYYANLTEEILDDYQSPWIRESHERQTHDRERQTLEEKFWINWYKTYQHTEIIKPSDQKPFEPFIGPYNRTFTWEDTDGYMVYSNRSKEELERLRVQQLREDAKQRLIEKRTQKEYMSQQTSCILNDKVTRVQQLREQAKRIPASQQKNTQTKI